jgi:hypothetical protein
MKTDLGLGSVILGYYRLVLVAWVIRSLWSLNGVVSQFNLVSSIIMKNLDESVVWKKGTRSGVTGGQRFTRVYLMH